MKFEVGKSYYAADSGYDPITIVRRTAKSVLVNNGTNTWRMYIREDQDGNEYVCDSTAGPKWRGAFTYSAKWAAE